jgi:phosphopantothenoylcysteine decarboxylase/phosphopantothenate--cysteine ligase
MYGHPTTARNLKNLENDGVVIIPAETGELASGLEGEGRMAEPETIFNAIRAELNNVDFEGVNTLITAGPTYESIDPVRFIGNHSSGKMGYSIAQAMLNAGAKVTLITGPVHQALSDPNLKIINVTTAEEMFEAVKAKWSDSNLGIFTAAVADYRPKEQHDQKIKKEDGNEELTIELVKNPDILAWAGGNKSAEQFLVGFALETEDVERNAETKLIKKNLDLIVMNSLEDKGAGFGSEKNKISILDKHNNLTSFELKPKDAVALDILNYLKKSMK